MKTATHVAIMIVLTLFSTAAVADAADVSANNPGKVNSEEAKACATSPAGPVEKAERGLTNVLLGWTEIPGKVISLTKKTNPVQGLVFGVFQGTCNAFVRTVSGVADVVTFPIGRYDKPVIAYDTSDSARSRGGEEQ
ncbi:MAG: exosortase system-associated protein, TIGR04073 family [Candidatus Omnitrophota bacterium]